MISGIRCLYAALADSTPTQPRPLSRLNCDYGDGAFPFLIPERLNAYTRNRSFPHGGRQ